MLFYSNEYIRHTIIYVKALRLKCSSRVRARLFSECVLFSVLYFFFFFSFYDKLTSCINDFIVAMAEISMPVVATSNI